MPSNCPPDELLSAYLAGDLSASRGLEVGQHIDSCQDCQALIEAARRQRAQARKTPERGEHADSEGSGLARELEVGTRLGRYELVELIGAGGMGYVYRARDEELDRDVALKVLRPGLGGAAELLTARLLRESKLMARLSHRNVVAVYDVGRHGQLVYVAMELIRGSTLSQWITAARSVDEVLEAFVAAGRGLIAAHQAGLVHRDFKPDNVLVATDEQARAVRVVVTDLGVARALTIGPPGTVPAVTTSLPADAPLRSASASGSLTPARSSTRAAAVRGTLHALTSHGPAAGEALERLTAPGATVGTPAYMAPEQLEGRPVDQRADIFAFAASLWEALWGCRPYPGRTLSEIATAMSLPPVRWAPRGRIPRRVGRALARALSIDVNRRTSTLAELLDEIDPAHARRRRRTAALAGGAIVAVAGLAVALLAPGQRATDACAEEVAEVAALLSNTRTQELRAALGGTAEAEHVIGALRQAVTSWTSVRKAQCGKRQTPTDALAAACLAARRTELAGAIDDLISEPALVPLAERYLEYVADPMRCQRPTSGMAFSRLPDDPAQRQAVRRLRARILGAESLRFEGKQEEALARLRDARVAAETRWPPVYAEALYAEGGAEGKIGDSARAAETLKRAAAVAEKAHHDQIAASAWTQLVSAATFAANDVERALEYATYADAALDRIGRPPLDELLWLYTYGATLAQADRADEAEARLQGALRLAESFDRSKIPLIIQGLGFLYDTKGQYAKAVAMYREAIATSKEPRPSIAVFHAQLAMNLAKHGEREAALEHANIAVRDASDGVDPRNDEWQTIKGARILVLRHLGRFDEALADIPAAQARAAAARGKRSADVAFYEQLEAALLVDVGKLAEAEPLLRRACETLAIAIGEGSIDHAGCLADHAALDLEAGRLDEALAHAEDSIRSIEGLRSFHADVAAVYQVRGELLRRRGELERAAADFDRAISLCPPYADRGYLASARLAKARLLAMTDKPAALALLQQAIEAWQPDAGMWRRQLAEARALAARLAR